MRFAEDRNLPVRVDLPTPAQIIEGGRAMALEGGQTREEHDAAILELTNLFAFNLEAARLSTRGSAAAVVRRDPVRDSVIPKKVSGSQAA